MEEFLQLFKKESPDITYKEKAIDFINSFKKAKSRVNGTGSLPRFLENHSYERVWGRKPTTSVVKDFLQKSLTKKSKYLEVYVCANTDNFASIRVIENNEGIFVKSYYEEKYGGKCNCYKIKVSSNGKIMHTNKKET